jgi:DNA-binding MarR family transcriptional regulator
MPHRTPAAESLTRVMLDFFRLNSALLAAGDRLVEKLGLTSARWQILGAISDAETSQPVASIARDLRINRQNVQRIVNDLVTDGLVKLEPNPYHQRAQLVVLTGKGRRAFDAAMELQIQWANKLTLGLTSEDIAAAHLVVAKLQQNLEDIDSANHSDR